MEEDLRGYLDWITQAEDLDHEPTSGLGANNSNSKDNGTGNMTTSELPIQRKTSEVIWGVLKSSMVPMILHENGNSSEGIIDVESWTTSLNGKAGEMLLLLSLYSTLHASTDDLAHHPK